VSQFPFLSLISPAFGQTGFVISETACAAALKPSAILVSIGNNDALQALTFGIPPTPPDTFALQYTALLQTLSATGADLIVSNIPNVQTIPFLVPAPAFTQICGFPPAGANNDDFVVLNLTKPAGGTILWFNYAVRSKALIDSVAAAITAYNKVIAAQVRNTQSVLVDVNAKMNNLLANGYNVQVGGQTRHLTTNFRGGIFSLDGIHPSLTGYAILANTAIDAINSTLPKGKQLPTVNVNNVATTDPLVTTTAYVQY